MPPLTDKQKEYYRLWRIKHKERLKDYNRNLQLKHRVNILKRAKEKYAKEKLNRGTSEFFKWRDNNRFFNKIKALQKVSGKLIPECCICGITDPRILSINHINGRVLTDKRNSGNMALEVHRGRDISDLDVRCHNCNILYEFERGKRGPKNWEELYNEIINK